MKASQTPLSNDAPSGVLSKSLAVLQAFTVEDNTLGFAELRRRTGFAKSTLHRVLGDLVAARLQGHLGRLVHRAVQGSRPGGRVVQEPGPGAPARTLTSRAAATANGAVPRQRPAWASPGDGVSLIRLSLSPGRAGRSL
ncbi:helix-turn-helix domain-containing protein [Streptomyces humi]